MKQERKYRVTLLECLMIPDEQMNIFLLKTVTAQAARTLHTREKWQHRAEVRI